MSVDAESVKELLNSSDFGDRIQGLNQLRGLDPAVGFELIQPMVQDKNVRVRYAAVCQLATLGTQDRARSLPLLRAGLQDKEPDVQAAAADAIGALQLTEAFEDLKDLYETTPEWIVKLSIIAPLGEFGDPRSFELLEDALQSGNELLAMSAIGALGEIRDERAIALLTPFVQNADWQMRYRVALALAHYTTPEAQSMLELLAQDAVPQVAEQAKAGLVAS
ncbi:phycobilisome degradation protein NblB [Alkalinema sp. FACHB-956]|uniref:phycobilisome degradation protein NblB n=1 Tax=Alkalinema sp. FACHB-956 TaxID=2692768 RepID=UPI001689330C|nr:HEAT repeat domain-containing protein [Alkalinema sp. FACHB-956]MBD2326029.1 HEAT repeat domain-containing protein [Alkalinema sp. FACHB-956]